MVITFIILVWRTRFPLCCPLPPVLPWRAPPPPPQKKKTLNICFIIRPPMKWFQDGYEIISFQNVLYFGANHDDSVEENFVLWIKSFSQCGWFYWRKFCNSKSFSPALSFTSCHGPTRKRIDPAENIKEIQTYMYTNTDENIKEIQTWVYTNTDENIKEIETYIHTQIQSMNLYTDEETSFAKSYFFIIVHILQCHRQHHNGHQWEKRWCRWWPSPSASSSPTGSGGPHNGLRADIFIIFITIASNIIHRKENIFEKLFLWFCHLVRRHQPPIFLRLRHCIFTV